MQKFEIATIRPPTENFSLSINTHFYCPWGKCEFCPNLLFHGARKFKRRTLEEIKTDIDNAAILNNFLLEKGDIDQRTIFYTLTKYPMLRECISHLVYWHKYTQASTAFIGGTNPLIYNSDFLTKIISYLRSTFPSIRRITSYGRTKSAIKRNERYFTELHETGLDRIHVGLESGSDTVLKFINKGVTSEEHITGGRIIKSGGISLCVYVMPGLGGKKWSIEHALETAKVINTLEPDYVRLRTLEIFQFTPLYTKKKSGLFEELTEEEVVKEERILIENIDCNTTITSDSAANLLIDVWGTLPKDKKKILQVIDSYLSLNPYEKLEFSLKRRLEAYNSQYGEISPIIEKKLENLSKLSKDDSKYYNKIEKTIKFIRSRLIP